MNRTAYIGSLAGISKTLVERLQTARVFRLHDEPEVAADKIRAHRTRAAATKQEAAAAKLAHQRRLVADCKRQGLTLKETLRFLAQRKRGLAADVVSQIWRSIP